MRPPAFPFCLAALLALASPAAAQLPHDHAYAAYHTALTRQCAVKHLGWLNPGILADPVGDFLDGLPARQRVQADQMIAAQCAHSQAGAACGNLAAIHAAARFKITSRLATIVCREHYLCTAPYDCREIGY